MNLLKRMREAAGLTVRELLADYPDKRIDKALYSKIENGIVEPPSALIDHILRVCGPGMEMLDLAGNTPVMGVATEKLVLPYIGIGKKNAVTRQYLKIATNLPDRSLRMHIRKLREVYPICNDQDGAGYYIADTQDEIKRFIRQEENRAMEILGGLSGLYRAVTEVGKWQ